jgi:hypothetical protein
MKVWPIITLVGLFYGSFYADGMSVPRESNTHSRHHRSEFDPDDFTSNLPHRPATIAYRQFFELMMAQETEWTNNPHGDKQTTTGDTHDLVDDDPGKKMFWHTIWNPLDPIPFTGWGDPNPTPNPQFPIYNPQQFTNCCGNLAPAPIQDPPNITTDITHIPGVNDGLTGEQIKALNNITVTTGVGGVQTITSMPCETIIVNGVCPAPCKGNDDPLCKDDDDGGIPVTLKPPVIGGGPDPVGGGTGPLAGGGSGSGFGGGSIGSGGAVGTVPETGTWLMSLIGFTLLGAIGVLRRGKVPA